MCDIENLSRAIFNMVLECPELAGFDLQTKSAMSYRFGILVILVIFAKFRKMPEMSHFEKKSETLFDENKVSD